MSTKTVLFQPPLRNSDVPLPMQKWFLTLQNLHPMIEVDTSNGAITETLPPAGLNEATGQSNQNAEHTYVSLGAHPLTIQGAATPVVITGAGSVAQFKSNGTVWRLISGQTGGGPTPGGTPIILEGT